MSATTQAAQLSFVPFAETERLYIRAFRMSDVDPLIAMFNDPRVLRTNPAFFVPGSEGGGAGTLRDKLPVRAASALLWAMLESKEPLEDGSTWAGMVGLAVDGSPKNREVGFAICLDKKFEGKGLGMSHFNLVYGTLTSFQVPRRLAGWSDMPSTNSECIASIWEYSRIMHVRYQCTNLCKSVLGL
jgi:hypothetical protein